MEHRRPRILSIEDDDRIGRMFVRALADVGDVEWASTLKAGLHRLSRGGIDLVLLDLGLPDSAGADSLKTLVAEYPWVPVIVVSGDVRVDVAEETIRLGADDFILKPLVQERLVWSVRLALARMTARRTRQYESQSLARMIETIQGELKGLVNE